MLKTALFCAAITVAGIANAQPASALAAVRSGEMVMRITADTCALTVRTIFVKIRSRLPLDTEHASLQRCAADGRSRAKIAHDEAVRVLGARQVPELAEWRLEWTSVFDATTPADSDTERDYFARLRDARLRAERASTKLGIALE